jgi:S1-C subfamily serine protease
MILTLTGSGAVQANPDIFERTLSATAFVLVPGPGGQTSIGTGVLVSSESKRILTAYHVVGNRDKVLVIFPHRDSKGNLLTDPRYYQKNVQKLGIVGKVIAIDPSHDLALIEVNQLPSTVQAVVLAKDSPRIGEDLHTIGSSGADDETMWRYGPGKVRSVFAMNWQVKGMQFNSRVIENQIPSNPGDSGGPVVNNEGKLVGIIHGSRVDRVGLAYAIDIREIQTFLSNPPTRPVNTVSNPPARPVNGVGIPDAPGNSYAGERRATPAEQTPKPIGIADKFGSEGR